MASFDTKRGVDLDVPIGSISQEDIPSILINGNREYPRLYGLGQNYDHITLIDAFGSGGFSAPGFPHESWHAQKAIVSQETFFEEDPLVSRANVIVDGLFEWRQQSPVRGVSRYKDSKWCGTEISATSEALEEVPLYEDVSMKVHLSPVVTVVGGDLPLKVQSLASDYRLTFRFEGEPPTLSKAVNDSIVPFRDLLSLLMGFRAEIRSISFAVSGLKRSVRIYVPFVESHRDTLPKHAFQQMPLPYPKVKDRIQSMAREWLALSSDARRSANILLGFLANERSVYLDSKFVAAASAFEALSRVGHDQNDMPLEKFEKYMTVVKEEISNKHVRKWARRKLKYSNLASAGKLAHDTLDELEPFSSFIVPDRPRFERDHRNARNAYIHQNDNLGNGTALTGKNLHAHTEAVLFLVWGKLLSLLGVAPQELADALDNSSFHWNDLHRAQSMYRLEPKEKGDSHGNVDSTRQGKKSDSNDYE